MLVIKYSIDFSAIFLKVGKLKFEIIEGKPWQSR